MSKRTFIGLASAGVVLFGIIGSVSNKPQPSKLDSAKTVTSGHSSTLKVQNTPQVQDAPKAKPVCDGTTVTTDCTVDGTNYSTYIYHAAVPEQTHTATSTTYQKKASGYCTLCNDGTYSPSCATGRGACSYHGGVQEWNAPEYTNVPVTSSQTVVDAAAQAEYYEKITE